MGWFIRFEIGEEEFYKSICFGSLIFLVRVPGTGSGSYIFAICNPKIQLSTVALYQNNGKIDVQYFVK